MKRKFLGLALIAGLVLGLAACGGDISDNEKIKGYKHEVTQEEYNDAIAKENEKFEALYDDKTLGVTYHELYNAKLVMYNGDEKTSDEEGEDYTIKVDRANRSAEEIKKGTQNGEPSLDEHGVILPNGDGLYDYIYANLIKNTKNRWGMSGDEMLERRVFPVFVHEILHGRLYYIDGNTYTVVEEYEGFKRVIQSTVSKNSIKRIHTIDSTKKDGDKIISIENKKSCSILKFGKVNITKVDLDNLKDNMNN